MIEQVEASESLRDEVLSQAHMISDIVLDIRQKILDEMRTPDNLNGCILKEVDAFISTFEQPIQQLKDEFASNRELLLQQVDEREFNNTLNDIKEANEALQSKINSLLCKPPRKVAAKPFSLSEEDLHFIPNFGDSADKNDERYFQWPDSTTL